VETKANFRGGKSALCFDKASGTLAAKIVPLDLIDRVADQACTYSNYQEFGDKIFPRLVRCCDDGQLTLELRVIELNTVNLSAELFARPEGAQEENNCQARPNPLRLYTHPILNCPGAVSLKA